MTPETEITMKQLRPFWGRLTVMESPVDEEQRTSGLVVPIAFDGDAGIKRGVVLYLDDTYRDDGHKLEERIPAGTPVYYKGGTKIGDVVILEPEEILAYEAE